ncbi:hypothetical protein ACP70R_009489 [Stipagrostis hirtigluma subsp. patula]
MPIVSSGSSSRRASSLGRSAEDGEHGGSSRNGGGHGGSSRDGGGHGGSSGDDGENGGGSGDDGDSSYGAGSWTDSEPPPGLPNDQWHGQLHRTHRRCKHGLRPAVKVCWTEDGHFGRRFLGCPLEEDEDQCNYVHWVDGAWEPTVQRALRELWATIDGFRTEAREAQGKLRRAEQAMESMAMFYEWRLTHEGVDKKKWWILAFSLVGIIVAMLYVVVLPKVFKW